MLKYIIVTQEDPFYIKIFFNEFLMLLEKGKIAGNLEGVFILRAFNESRWALIKRLHGLYGPVDFMRLLYRYGLSRVERFLARMGAKKRFGDITDLCKAGNIHVQELTNVNAPDFVDWIKKHEIDIIVSISASQIFKKKLLEAPRLTRINIHNGRLPDYRGMLPNFWQLFNGETASTMTVHTMGERLDTGTILAEVETPIRPGMSLDALIRETKRKSAHVLGQMLRDYTDDKIIALREIKPAKGAYYSFPAREHAKKVRRAGHPLL